ncbi:MAG: tetratricopeptide repeat protein [Chloroflexota bacterium]
MKQSLKIFLLGGLTIERESKQIGFTSRKELALFAYLIYTGKPHSREALADLLWEGRTQKQSQTNLRSLLSRLRRNLGDYLLIDRQTVAINPAQDYWLDVAELEQRLIAAQTEFAQTGQLSVKMTSYLTAAIDLYEGDFLNGIHFRDAPRFENWVLTERERLRQEVTEGLHKLIDYYMIADQFADGIEQANRLLTLDPLDEAAHRQMMRLLAYNGQRSAALAQYDVCQQILARDLDVEPSEDTKVLYDRIRQDTLESTTDVLPRQPSVIVPDKSSLPTSSSQQVHNLPAQLTPFIGREPELAQIADILGEPTSRLLTLIGPGGIGKTRLALEAAKTHLGSFADGVYFVALASVTSPDLFVATLTQALPLSLQNDEPAITQLHRYLKQKEMLLVLDNFEHLLAAVDVVLDILQNTTNLKILTVSRQRLNVKGEWLFKVDGLSYPDADDIENAENYSAVRLFVQSARRVQPSFTLSPSDIPFVVKICQLVAGLPLALELAAAWRRVLSCQEIAEEIEQDIDFLATSLHDIPERHRSLRVVFDYSWNLLSAEEQRIFRELSVFRGSFDRIAAGQVVGADLGTLAMLTDVSLLRRYKSSQPQAGVRYGIHDLLYHYASEKLDESDEDAVTLQEKHANYYVALLQRREPDLKGMTQREALDELDSEIENIRTAWNWLVDQERISDLGQALESLFLFYEMRSLFQEGEQLFGKAVQLLRRCTLDKSTSIVLGQLLARQGWFSFLLDKHHQAQTLMQEGLALLQRHDAYQQTIFCLNYLGAMSLHLGSYERTKTLCYESLAICRETNDAFGAAIALNILGEATYLLGDYDEARQRCEESLSLNSNRWGMAFTFEYLGQITYAEADYLEAKHLFQQSLDICQEMGDQRGIAMSLTYLGDTARALGEYNEAHALYQEGLRVFQAIGSQMGIAQSLTHLGYVAWATGDNDKAKQTFAEALQVAMEIQALPKALDALAGIAAVFARHEDSAEAFQLLLFVRDHASTTQESKDRIEGLYTELTAQLPSDVIKALKRRSRPRTLEEVVSGILDNA